LNGAAWIFTFTGAPDRAIECHLRYLDLARHALNVPISMGGMALCLIQLGKYEKALDWARRSMERSPNYVAAYRGAAAALAHLDRLEEAREMMEAHRRIMPDQTISNLRESCKFVDTLGTRRYFDGLRKAGMPD
jgi:tetratricopeptide (TPR) repeat protein